MTLYKWSQTAASNASADSTINWAEGMAPSAVNDSARAVMAAVAKYRDDVSGFLFTGGTSSAYTLATNSVFSSRALMSGQTIAFTVHATNADAPTLNVDGLGAAQITANGIAIAAGTLISNSPYTAVYNSAGNVWGLLQYFGQTSNVPVGTVLDYSGATAPNSSFALCYGQAINRATYATLFSLTSTTFGVGDGSTTFNIPDLRGRIIAGKDDMGGSAASRLTSSYFGTSATSLGAAGGAESHTLTTAQLASHTHTGTTGGQSATHTHTSNDAILKNVSASSGGGVNNLWSGNQSQTSGNASADHSHSFTTNTSGSSNAHNNVQPTFILNKIIRIL